MKLAKTAALIDLFGNPENVKKLKKLHKVSVRTLDCELMVQAPMEDNDIRRHAVLNVTTKGNNKVNNNESVLLTIQKGWKKFVVAVHKDGILLFFASFKVTLEISQY